MKTTNNFIELKMRVEAEYTGKHRELVLELLDEKIQCEESDREFIPRNIFARYFPNYNPKSLRQPLGRVRKELAEFNSALEEGFDIVLTEQKFTLEKISYLHQRSLKNSPGPNMDYADQQGYPTALQNRVFFVPYRHIAGDEIFNQFMEDLEKEVNRFNHIDARGYGFTLEPRIDRKNMEYDIPLKDWIQKQMGEADRAVYLLSSSFFDRLNSPEDNNLKEEWRLRPKNYIGFAYDMKNNWLEDYHKLEREEHCVITDDDGNGYVETPPENKRALIRKLILAIAQSFNGTPPSSEPFPGNSELYQKTFVGAKGAGGKDYERMRSRGYYENAEYMQTILTRWLDEEETPVLGLLGEYGIGKTTNLQVFTDSLNKRKNNKYAPVFIDLRKCPIARSQQDWNKIPVLDIIVDTLNDSLRTGQKSWEKENLERGILDNRVLLILDGLDEILVHLDERDVERFVNKLWTIFPEKPLEQWRQYYKAMQSDNKKVKPKKPEICRMIISCRSHYFKNFDAQIATLFNFYRESGMKNEHLSLYTLLPFTKGQIITYLEKKLPPTRSAQSVIEMFENIHNLMELAERPVLLNMLTEILDRLDDASQGNIQPIDVYKMVLERWLERDKGKHTIPVDYKPLVMEALASHIWKEETASISFEKLGIWLDIFKSNHPLVVGASRNRDTEQWKEDLRTATYIVRPQDDVFEFAHRSFLEFFLARHLWRTLSDSKLWDGTPRPDNFWTDFPKKSPSPECLDFLYQFYTKGKEGEKACFQESLRQGLASGDAQRLYLFQWWMLAWQKGLHIDLKGIEIDLSRMDLSNHIFYGLKDKPLPLERINFRKSSLRDARFEYCHLKECRFDNALLYGSTWVRAEAGAVSSEGMKTDFAIFRHCRGGFFDSDNSKIREIPRKMTEPAPDSPKFLFQDGHATRINSCAWSPDGTLIVSASDDRTVKVWEAASGKLLNTLSGHEGWVRSCAWSPDGTLIVSASDDRTVKVWEAASGKLLNTLSGHEGPVLSCAWSPDGTRIVSASSDNTVKVWEAASGKLLNTLSGHGDWVRSCAWSPDGTRIVSASDDRTVKVWEAASGKLLNTLSGHAMPVLSCAWSPRWHTHRLRIR